jgi:hypothetical protein
MDDTDIKKKQQRTKVKFARRIEKKTHSDAEEDVEKSDSEEEIKKKLPQKKITKKPEKGLEMLL